jgi:hypothetical protein
MKFIKTGEYRPDALELPIETDFWKAVQEMTLKRLNYLLGFIKENKPNFLRDYIDTLEAKYQILTEQNIGKNVVTELETRISDLVHLRDYPNLVRNVVGYQLQILQLPDGVNWVENQVKVATGNNIRAHLHFRYYNLLALTEILDRKEAISFYKRFVTNFIIDTRDPERKRYDDLETVFEEHTKPTDEVSIWIIVRGMIADGKYAYRNDNCLWIEALEDLPDSELKYLICCYGDYEGAKRYHESIVLTMEHTIAQGDPYCSRVLHDTRVDWDLRHPSKEFWDNIEYE